MKHYIGIDLGTTNSAICSFDGQNVRIWKSPEQNDVTPTAIYVDRRGNRYYGTKAYNQAPYNPTNSATLFTVKVAGCFICTTPRHKTPDPSPPDPFSYSLFAIFWYL